MACRGIVVLFFLGSLCLFSFREFDPRSLEELTKSGGVVTMELHRYNHDSQHSTDQNSTATTTTTTTMRSFEETASRSLDDDDSASSSTAARGPNEVSPYLQSYPKLQELVQLWRNSTDDEEQPVLEATKLLREIVESRDYLEHKPNAGIVFVKTFKTGSSTMTSILHSIATTHKLKVPVVGIERYDLWPGDRTRTHTTSLSTHGAPYDVWCNHIEYRDALLHEIVPTSQNKFVSILREPGTRMRSASTYIKQCNKSERTTDIPQWNEMVLRGGGMDNFQFMCKADSSAKQVMGAEATDQQKLKETYEKAEQGQLLLMIMERMSESLLAFQKFYDLHPLDVTYFAMKIRAHKEESKENVQALERMREWNPVDVEMHQFASELLTKRLHEIFSESADTTGSSQSTDDVIQQATAERDTLNDAISRVCDHVVPLDSNGKMSRKQLLKLAKQSEVRNNTLLWWCTEKKLDNKPWMDFHQLRLDRQTRIPFYDPDTATMAKESSFTLG